jgi:hypothetical protein
MLVAIDITTTRSRLVREVVVVELRSRTTTTDPLAIREVIVQFGGA